MDNNILQVLKEQKETKFKSNLYHNGQIKFSSNTTRIEGLKEYNNQTGWIITQDEFIKLAENF